MAGLNSSARSGAVAGLGSGPRGVTGQTAGGQAGSTGVGVLSTGGLSGTVAPYSGLLACSRRGVFQLDGSNCTGKRKFWI